MQSPGGDRQTGTTDNSTMKDFQKMINYLKKNKKGGKAAGKASKGSVSKKR
jgi:hypothetical protein